MHCGINNPMNNVTTNILVMLLTSNIASCKVLKMSDGNLHHLLNFGLAIVKGCMSEIVLQQKNNVVVGVHVFISVIPRGPRKIKRDERPSGDFVTRCN